MLDAASKVLAAAERLSSRCASISRKQGSPDQRNIAMPRKRSSRLPWDLEQAMSAFQVDSSWYEEYWLTPPKPRPPGMIAQLVRRANCSVSRATADLKHALAAIGEAGANQPAVFARNSVHSAIIAVEDYRRNDHPAAPSPLGS